MLRDRIANSVRNIGDIAYSCAKNIEVNDTNTIEFFNNSKEAISAKIAQVDKDIKKAMSEESKQKQIENIKNAKKTVNKAIFQNSQVE